MPWSANFWTKSPFAKASDSDTNGPWTSGMSSDDGRSSSFLACSASSGSESGKGREQVAQELVADVVGKLDRVDRHGCFPMALYYGGVRLFLG